MTHPSEDEVRARRDQLAALPRLDPQSTHARLLALCDSWLVQREALRAAHDQAQIELCDELIAAADSDELFGVEDIWAKRAALRAAVGVSGEPTPE